MSHPGTGTWPAESTVPTASTVSAESAATEPADERTVDELIADAESRPEPGAMGARLAQVRGHAERDGVRVSTDLHGMLVALEFTDAALELPPAVLAGTISALAGQAASAALRHGVGTLAEECGPVLAALVSEQLGLDLAPQPGRDPEPEPERPAAPEPPAAVAAPAPPMAPTPPERPVRRPRRAPVEDEDESLEPQSWALRD